MGLYKKKGKEIDQSIVDSYWNILSSDVVEDQPLNDYLNQLDDDDEEFSNWTKNKEKENYQFFFCCSFLFHQENNVRTIIINHVNLMSQTIRRSRDKARSNTRSNEGKHCLSTYTNIAVNMFVFDCFGLTIIHWKINFHMTIVFDFRWSFTLCLSLSTFENSSVIFINEKIVVYSLWTISNFTSIKIGFFRWTTSMLLWFLIEKIVFFTYGSSTNFECLTTF